MKPIMLLVFLLLMATSESVSDAWQSSTSEFIRAYNSKTTPVLKPGVSAAPRAAALAATALAVAEVREAAKDDKYDPKAAMYDKDGAGPAKDDPNPAKYLTKYDPLKMYETARVQEATKTLQEAILNSFGLTPSTSKYSYGPKYDPKTARYDTNGNPATYDPYTAKYELPDSNYHYRGEASKKLGSYYGLLADAVRPKSQASPGAGGVGVAQTAPLVLVAVGALLVTVARRRSAPASTMPLL